MDRKGLLNLIDPPRTKNGDYDVGLRHRCYQHQHRQKLHNPRSQEDRSFSIVKFNYRE